MRIAESIMSNQLMESRHCGFCSAKRPQANELYEHPPGWDYVMVRSGINPVRKWKCPECKRSGLFGVGSE